MTKSASEIGRSNVQTAKAHERRVASLLSEWSGVKFRRRRVEGRTDDVILRDMTGDVVPIEKLARFNIEAKKGKGFSLTGLFADPTHNVFSTWWHQSTYDATIATRAFGKEILPLVFFKPHPNFDFVAVPVDCRLSARSDVALAPGVSIPTLWNFPHVVFDYYTKCGEISMPVGHTKNRKNWSIVPLKLPACIICSWRDFAANIDPTSFFHN